MSEYEAGQVTKNGTTVPIKVNDEGQWKAKVGNDYLSRDTRSALVSAIDTLTKRAAADVAVRFIEASDNTRDGGMVFRTGTAYGIHSGTGNVLVVWDKKDARGRAVKEQYRGDGGWRSTVLPGDTDHETLARFAAVEMAFNKARDDKEALRKELKFSLREAVEAELTKAHESD